MFVLALGHPIRKSQLKYCHRGTPRQCVAAMGGAGVSGEPGVYGLWPWGDAIQIAGEGAYIYTSSAYPLFAEMIGLGENAWPAPPSPEIGNACREPGCG